MTSAAYGVSLGGLELEQHGSLSPANKNTETFVAFLDMFTEVSCPLSDMREKRTISSYTDEGRSCQQSCSKIMNAATTTRMSVATGEYLPYQAATDGCDITRARPSKSSTETCVDSSPLPDKDETATNVSRAINGLSKSGVVLYSSVRTITNATYLRRMHLSREDAVRLFPEVKSTLDLVNSTKMSRRESLAPFKKGRCVHVHDIEGRRWPVLIECLRTAGQRHVRLNKGWAEMCSANGLSIGRSVRLARWKEILSPSSSSAVASSHGTFVTLSTI